MRLLKDQQRVANEYLDTRLYLDGLAGTGKTTAAIERVKTLIRNGVPASSILIWVPQATLAIPYRRALQRARIDADTNVPTTTIGKLAYDMVNLFWPILPDAVKKQFGQPKERPNFLSLELVQYYMTRHLGPEIDAHDYFNSVHISRNRLYTQIVDNLNKAALVGFAPDTIGDRLKSALGESVEQSYIYDDAQTSAAKFRELCLQHNLLDFSLQVELFVKHLWPLPEVQRYLTGNFRHLIVDNIEEDTPASHDILRDWLPQTDSALLINDSGGGYRRFLGADPINAAELRDLCQVHITLDNHRVMSKELEALHDELAFSLHQTNDMPDSDVDARDAIAYAPDISYQPQMITWAAESIASLVHEQGVPPREIVIMAPYMPDALRFSLQKELDLQLVPHRSHRPSRALREETASRTLLTLARLAYPQWNLPANKFDVTNMLAAAITELDLIRARLLADVLYRQGKLAPFTGITNDALTQRITFDLGMRYQTLFDWLQEYQSQDALPLDIFFSKLFGEVLSQPGFGFHGQTDAANVAANLIDSAQSFRQTISEIDPTIPNIGLEYVKMVEEGVIANQYLRDWEDDKRDAVLIAPAYTFLLANQPVDYQFWLNVGSSGWAQRLYQPLTHPYVLSRQWQSGRRWTDDDEVRTDEQTLAYLALGLVRRCRKQIYLGFSQYSEQGYEQRGDLLMGIQTMLRRLNRSEANA